MTGGNADGGLMEGCGNVEEVKAFRANLTEGAKKKGRDPSKVKVLLRLNACVSPDGKKARDGLRLGVARMLAAGRLKFMTAEKQGLLCRPSRSRPMPTCATPTARRPTRRCCRWSPTATSMPSRSPASPDEVVQHMKDLKAAGADGFIVFPFACEGTTAEQTLVTLGKDVWPRVNS